MLLKFILLAFSIGLCISEETSNCDQNAESGSCPNVETNGCSRCPQSSGYGEGCSSCDICSFEERKRNPRPEYQCQFTTDCDNCKCGDPSKKPHIVMFMLDDWGWGDAGFHGSCKVNTPNFDDFFYSGTVLNRFYVNKVCSPSRCAYMTGKYAWKTGMTNAAILGGQPYCCPTNIDYLSNYMQEMCYRTYLVGKWNLGLYKKECWPLQRGFDCHLGYLGSHSNYYNGQILDQALIPQNITNQQLIKNVGAIKFNKNQVGMDIRDQNYMNYDLQEVRSVDYVNQRILQHIELHNKSCPMFLYIAHPEPHADNLNRVPATDAYLQRQKGPTDPKEIRRLKMRAMMEEMDNTLGLMMNKMKEKHMLDNAYIFVMTDNGGDPLAGPGSNCPLFGGKFTNWEGGLRAIAAAWSSNMTTGGKVNNEYMHITDLLPTMVSIAGGRCDNKSLGDIDGVNQHEAIFYGKPSPRKSVIHEIDTYAETSALVVKINETWWKYVKGTFAAGALNIYFGYCDRDCTYDLNAVRNSSVYKAFNKTISNMKINQIRSELTINCKNVTNCTITNSKESCLFDMDKDPCENYNVAPQQPDIVTIMETTLSDKMANVGEPRIKKFLNEADPKNWCNEWTNYGDCLNLQY